MGCHSNDFWVIEMLAGILISAVLTWLANTANARPALAMTATTLLGATTIVNDVACEYPLPAVCLLGVGLGVATCNLRLCEATAPSVAWLALGCNIAGILVVRLWFGLATVLIFGSPGVILVLLAAAVKASREH
jgi:hypothetical protein